MQKRNELETLQPLLSAILPVYNGQLTLSSTIGSIQDQTWQNWELVIVDDGSTDDSFNLCRQMAAGDSRIKLFRNSTNLGLAPTLNRLIQLSKSDFIAMQEQDDISLPDRLEKEAAILMAHPEVGLVSGMAEWLDGDGNVTNKFPGILVRGSQFPQSRNEMIKYLYVEQSKIVNAACMFRRSLLEHIPGPYDEKAKISIDWQFFLHLAHHTLVWGIPEVIVRMRRGALHKHLTSQKELQFKEARRCIKKIYIEYKNKPESPINYHLYRKSMSYELTLEGRFYGGFKSAARIFSALIYDPANKKAWRSLGELIIRGFKKLSGDFKYE